MARLPRPAASLSLAGSIYCLHLVPHSVPLLAPPTTSGSTAEPTGPRPGRAGKLAVESAESNRNSLSGPRRIRLDTRPASDRVSPPAPDGLYYPVAHRRYAQRPQLPIRLRNVYSFYRLRLVGLRA